MFYTLYSIMKWLRGPAQLSNEDESCKNAPHDDSLETQEP
jgi:hypothetical protein